MKKISIFILICFAFSLTVTGCATTRSQPTIDNLSNRIHILEDTLRSKEREIARLEEQLDAASQDVAEKDNKFAGYTVENIEIPTEPEELDTPTIFRVKGTNKILSEEKSVPTGGFKLDQLDAFEGAEVEEKKDRKKDRGGSSFLRMMMD